MAWQLTYYSARVAQQIDAWPLGIRAGYLRIVEAMTRDGPDLGMPYTRAMGGGLFEVRAKGREGIGRAFYCTTVGRRIVILHGFINKKTEQTPTHELDRAHTTQRGEAMSTDRYQPVPFDVKATKRRWMRDPKFRAAYEALEDEFAALAELLRARREAGLTQAEVAERMGVAQAAVGRLESSAGSRKHAPSLATLRRYADAVGCDVRIVLAPKAVPTRRKRA